MFTPIDNNETGADKYLARCDESAQRPENYESPWVGFVATRGTVQGKMQRTKDIDVSVVASPTYEARMWQL